jgi:hypothetical protein
VLLRGVAVVGAIVPKTSVSLLITAWMVAVSLSITTPMVVSASSFYRYIDWIHGCWILPCSLAGYKDMT